jgi:hypothetical protein
MRSTIWEERHRMVGGCGPLAELSGEWESDQGGLDAAFSPSKDEVLQTPYLEKVRMKPFGLIAR